SIRWALRQLALPGGDFIFDNDGELRASSFDIPTWTALRDAVRLSSRSGLSFLGTPHFVASLLTGRGLLSRACEAANVAPQTVQKELLGIVGERAATVDEFELSRQTL